MKCEAVSVGVVGVVDSTVLTAWDGSVAWDCHTVVVVYAAKACWSEKHCDVNIALLILHFMKPMVLNTPKVLIKLVLKKRYLYFTESVFET